LVAASLAGFSIPVAWLSLDQDDSQVVRFLAYLIGALQTIDAQIGRGAAQLLEGMDPAPPQAVLASLINDLDAASGEMALVLDDYQFVTTQAVHQVVAFLVAHCPQNFHFVIASRSDPPLPF
jgi:LuxR family maltose regulon positive regulatory protein